MNIAAEFMPHLEDVERRTLDTAKYCMTRHTSLETIAPDFVNNIRTYVLYESDRFARGFAVTLETMALKGATTEEYRSINKDVVTYVFESWTDHLKYRFKAGRLFVRLPFKLRRFLFDRLKIRYIALKQTVTVTVPVKITRICPGMDLRSNPSPHIAFLRPASFTREGN